MLIFLLYFSSRGGESLLIAYKRPVNKPTAIAVVTRGFQGVSDAGFDADIL